MCTELKELERLAGLVMAVERIGFAEAFDRVLRDRYGIAPPDLEPETRPRPLELVTTKKERD